MITELVLNNLGSTAEIETMSTPTIREKTTNSETIFFIKKHHPFMLLIIQRIGMVFYYKNFKFFKKIFIINYKYSLKRVSDFGKFGKI